MKHQLADLLDIPRLQSSLDSLYIAAGIPSSILDTEGKILTGSGRQDVCTKFHHVHPEARKRCAESCLYIDRHIHEASSSMTHKCLLGLLENAAPIIIEGEHLGIVLTGQMFREAPDLEFFRAQAKVYGFDEGRYIAAVKKVPIVSEQASQENLAVIVHLTGMLVEMGLTQAREKEAGRRLKESEERYRALFQNTSSGFALHEIILDADGKPRDYRFLDVNPAFTTLTGFKAEDLIGHTVLEVMPGTEPYWIDTYGKVALTGIPVGFENFSRELDRHYSVTAYSLMHGRFATIFHDITERKRMEEELRRSQELLLQYMRYSPIYTYIKEVTPNESRVLYASDKFQQMIGISGRDIAGKSMPELFPAEFAAKITADDWAVVSNGEALELEEDFNGRNYTSIKFPIVQGDKTLLAGYTIDITERKRAEEELRESEERLFEAQQVARLGYYGFDAATGTWNSSKILDEVFGIGEDYRRDVEGWSLLIHPEERQSMREYLLNDVLEKKQPFNREYRIVRPSDRCVRWVHGLGRVERDPRGKPIKMIGTIQDITERKRMEVEKRNLERQVQQAQKLESLGVLAGGVAHDFNNLLMVVLGHAELALGAIPPVSPARGSLIEISTAAQRAAGLCQQMLAYAGKSSFALEPVGLGDLVEEMADLLKTTISKKAILTLNLEKGLPPVQADPSQIRQIVMNLIINASEAIGDRSGAITASVGATRVDKKYLEETELNDDIAPGLYVHLEVTDTGIGMDAETRARIFDPFFTTKFTGRGLGLAAVQGIVRAHKGALEVYSEPGRGTTFKVLFPALEDARELARPPDSSALSDWRGKGTILLVDDEERLIALGAKILEQLGFTVLTAADGLQAVERYRERGKEIDLVLMDVSMPRMDGAEAFGELRRLNPEVRVVLASGYSHDDVATRFAGKGLAGILQKPYTLAKLREALAGLLPKRP